MTTQTPLIDIYVLTGCPGSGKTSLGLRLRDALGGILLNLSDVRNMHLSPDWSTASLAEESMAVEVLLAVAKVYLWHRRVPLIVEDLRDGDALRVARDVSVLGNVRVVSLITNDDVIAMRLNARTWGFKDAHEAIVRNSCIMARPPVQGEVRIDTSKGLPLDLSILSGT